MKLNKKHPLYLEDLKNILQTKGIEQLSEKRILLTGATGLLGVHLIDALMLLHAQGANIKIYAVGRSKERAKERLGEYYDCPNFTFLEQNVQTPFEEHLKVDYIVSAASSSHPLAYSQYPVETIMVNIKGTEHALELARKCGATVLFLSSGEIYGNAVGQEDVFTEDYTGQLNLSTSRACYTESKRVCEAMCQSYLAEYGVKTKIARLSRIFGPTMLESDSKASSQFIKKTNSCEDIVLKSEGNQFFSYTYVTDAVIGLLYVLLHGEIGSAYNVCNERCSVRLKEFAQICADCIGKKVTFELPSETERKGYSIAARSILDNSRLRSIGYSSLYELKDAISRTIEILK